MHTMRKREEFTAIDKYTLTKQPRPKCSKGESRGPRPIYGHLYTEKHDSILATPLAEV